MNSNWDVELAKKFKQRDNKPSIGMLIGQIICTEPLKVSILEGKVILDNPYRCNNYIPNIGDSVVCLPDSTGQTFVVFDKVVM